MLEKTNHLANETSPYLQQHAHNPVNWYPWGKKALAQARQENKPILLSIGYSACHWCHVMAHESFEDSATAALMNQLFINIKVDREERPDLDKIYQTAHAILTQQGGGWPLTVFLSPQDLIPFFSGTYFPREEKYRLPAFKEVLQAISDTYHHRQDEVRQQNSDLLAMLQHQEAGLVKTVLTDEPIKLAISALQRNFDVINGGFNGAPKFPQPARLKYLLRNHSPLAVETLQHMGRGGVYDQLGGGFFRYSVDARWEIPHFEKMLYDNGQLLLLYALAHEQDHERLDADLARETAHWVMRDLQVAEGGYISSIDADSEGHEGKFYVWELSEVKALLNPEEYVVIRAYWGLDLSANFENKWHLHVTEPLASVADKLKLTAEAAKELIVSAKEKMLSARRQRVTPAQDSKILTSWNALMIKGMLKAGDHLQQPEFIASAQRAIEFIYKNLWQNKRLLASYNKGKAQLPAYLDDHAFLIDALITGLELHWNSGHLAFATDLAEIILTYFSDENAGGFYFTAKDHEQLLYRPKIMMDEATPAGNGVAVSVLLFLGFFLGETRYLDAAEKTLQAAWPMLIKYPAEHCSLLEGLEDFLNPPQIIVIRGKNPDLQTWRKLCKQANNYVFAIPENEPNLPESLNAKTARENTCAYICKGMQCLGVIDDLELLKNILSQRKNIAH